MKIDMKEIVYRLENKSLTKDEALSRISSLKNGDLWWSFQHGEPYLRDHTVFGEQVLLGVTHCALAINAVQKHDKGQPIQLSKMLFENPISLAQGESVDIRTTVNKQNGNKYMFSSVYQKSSSSSWTQGASAEFIVGTEFQRPARENLNKLLEADEVPGDEIYRRLSKTPVIHGETLRTVESVYMKDQSVVGKLRLAKEYVKNGSDYVVHPAMLDGAIVSSMCGIREEQRGAFIPLLIKKVINYAPLTERCYSVSKVVKTNPELIEVDITICDEQGEALLIMQGLTCKRVDSSSVKTDEGIVEHEDKRIESVEAGASKANTVFNRGESLGTRVEQYLADQISSLLPQDQVVRDKKKNFMDMGIDSTKLIELAQSMEKELGVELYPTLFFEHQNILDLANYFTEAFPEVLNAKFQIKDSGHTTPASSPTVQTVENPKSSTTVKEQRVEKPKSSTAIKEQRVADTISSTAVKEQKAVEADMDQDIAVIGMSGMFADSPDLSSFWDNLRNKKDLMKEIPKDHFDYRPWFDPTPYEPDKMYCKWGSFIDGVDKFDAEFFNISPREAEMMDPQLRLLMQVLYSTLEDAGYAGKIKGTRTGMYVGACFQDYKDRLPKKVDPHSGTGNAATMLANRPSFYFNLLGPSLFVDTACSSSLVALHLAATALRNKECDMAFVAGTNLLLSSHHYRYFCSIGALSSTGRCHTFDAAADGYVPGEGIGAVLIKPLKQALQDGDRVHAVIKGSAINHGGYTPSVTAPSMKQEAKVILDAWNDAGIDPTTIGYIEAHGTGTKLGDPVEINALKEAFKSYKVNKEPFCAVGSAKAHIGHSEGAAGVAGLIKVILSLKNKEIPAMPKFKELNPYIKLEDSPLYINNEVIPWEKPADQPRRAGVSSFGFGGAYAHVVVEEFIPDSSPSDSRSDESNSPHLILLSALNGERLLEKVHQLRMYIESNKESLRMEDIAYTLQYGREHMEERAAFIAENVDSLIQHLEAYEKGARAQQGIYTGNRIKDETSLQFIMTGASGADFIQSIYANNELDKLAQLWVWGSDPEWREAIDPKGSIISLPAYPFAKNRYWAAEDDAPSMDKETMSSIGKLNAQRSLLEGGLLYEALLSPESPVLKNHQVNGMPTMPAAAMLEMAVTAAAALESGETIQLEDTVFVRPMILEKPSTTELILKPDSKGQSFEIHSVCDGRASLHAQGKIKIGASLSVVPPIALDKFMKHASDQIGREVFYKAFHELGIQYGPFFKTVQNVWINGTEALCLLELQEETSGVALSYQIHPSLLDGAFQSILAINASLGLSEPYLPFSMESLEKVGPIGAKAYAYIAAQGKDKYDITLMDEQGKVGTIIRGLYVRKSNKPFSSFFYIPKWELSASTQPEHSTRNTGRKVIIAAPEGTERLARALKERHSMDETVMIQSNDQTFSAVDDLNIQNPDLIYFLGGFVTEQRLPVSIEMTSLEDIQEKGVMSLFHLLKNGVTRSFQDRDIQIKIITNNAFSIHNKAANPYAAGIFGFAKSIGMEYPHWTMQCIDVSVDLHNDSNEGLRSVVDSIIKENEGSKEVVLRDGNRYTQALYPAEIPKAEQSRFRKGGVYFIVGGAGGIGLELSRYLIQKYEAKIALIGRSSLDQKAKLIHDLGADVLYLQADVTNLVQMQKVVNLVKERFGRIDGVIHSALVLDDRTLERLNRETMLSVIQPKAAGSVVLYELFKDEALDFMLFLSSMQSFSGNAGQSNYAAACCLKDAIAHSIRKNVTYPVQIINWGYWGSVGVVANNSYQKKLAAQGIHSIHPSEGMEAIERILASGLPQAAAIKADSRVITAIGGAANKRVIVQPSMLKPILNTALNEVQQPVMEIAHVAQAREAFTVIRKFGQQMLLHAFRQMGVFRPGEKPSDREEIVQRLNMVPEYSGLLDGLLQIMKEAGYVNEIENRLTVSDTAVTLSEADLLHQKEQWASSYPDIRPQLELLWQCVSRYPDILAGRLPATDVLFPNSSMDLVEKIYQGNENTDYYHQLMAWSVEQYINKRLSEAPNRKIKFLEIGAGTGGTTSWILKVISKYKDRIEYVYTDISQAFLRFGEQKFYKDHPFIQFKRLNIEEDVAEQGFVYGDYDVVLAANVLHATQNIERTLEHVKALTAPYGWLLINEATQRMDFLTMTFGLLEGWWLFNDSHVRIEHSPLLSTSSWIRVLEREGFKGAVLAGHEGIAAESNQHVIIGESDGAITLPVRLGKDERIQPKSAGSTEIKRPSITLTQTTGSFGSQTSVPSYRDIQTKLKSCLATILQQSQNQIKNDKPFSEMGVDSILGLEFVKAINEMFEITLKTTVLFDYGTINDLSAYIETQFGGKIHLTDSREGQVVHGASHQRPFKPEPIAINEAQQVSLPSAPWSRRDLRTYISDHLSDFLRTTLKLTDREIKAEKQFTEYGVDSILGLELVKHVNDAFGISMRTTALFDYGNIRELSEHILKEYGDIISGQMVSGEDHDGSIETFTAEPDQENESRSSFDLLQKLSKGELSGEQVLKLLEVSHG